MQGSGPSTRNLAWDDVRLFLALCRARSLGAAAAALGVDASTVSRRLDALEGALAATLFERGRGGIAPTEAAENLMPVAEEIEHAVARFASEAEGLERAVAGLVRIACPPDVAEVIVAPLVPEPSLSHYGLVPPRTSAALRDGPAWPQDELFLVTHRALRKVPRVRVVWDLLVERVGERLGRE